MTRRTAASIAIGLTAVAFLFVMVFTGARPEQRQLVKFEAKGVMQVPPERITRVELTSDKGFAVLVRTEAQAWIDAEGKALPPALAKRVSMAVQFMNTSEPVRVLEPADVQAASIHELGLDRPQLSIGLFEGNRKVLAAAFGRRNPDGLLQYVAVEGRPEIFLLSHFVGEEWRAAAGAGSPKS